MFSLEKIKVANFQFQEDGERLDVFLHSKLRDFSRERLKKLIREGRVKVNCKKVVKPGCKLKCNDNVLITIDKVEQVIIPQDIPITVVYEDRDIAVINKPAGLLTHPVSLNGRPALVNALLYKFNQLSSVGGPLKPGIIHRLDKDTSGLLIIAKNNSTHINISDQFKKRLVLKKYLAVVEGEMIAEEGVIERPIARGKYQRKKMKIDYSKGKDAKTYFKVLKRLHSYTFVLLYPKTGRTHQLRVHMKDYGHSIIGDSKYGRKSTVISRQALHAFWIEFKHPKTKENMRFQAPLPKDFEDLLMHSGIKNYLSILENLNKEV
ncbi:MAG: RluA family pseudouridine synthase [Candidatus Saelkia tenebricola]|nr:RluA family pseudouridine synthase [Candidatus Saelkia tenebricola]